MTTHTPTIAPDQTVGQIIKRVPESLEVFQQYQAGTKGICVITQDDSLRELADRFDVSIDTVIDEIRSRLPVSE